jgi:hypothetical protein
MQSYQLRKGVTKNLKLNRLKQFDERSRNFAYTTPTGPAEQRALRSYTWRCGSWFDQGLDGACVAFAIGHELAARPSEVRVGLNAKFLKEKIYWEAQKIDPWKGGSYPGASPRYEGTSVLAGIKVAHKLGYFEEYRWAFAPYSAMYGIGHHGPAIIGINWYEGMLDTDSKGYIHPTGPLLGGHAILVRGIHVPTRTVLLRNSWGYGWGVKGDCKLSFEDFSRLLGEDGECAFFVKRKTTPKPKPQSFSCRVAQPTFH